VFCFGVEDILSKPNIKQFVKTNPLHKNYVALLRKNIYRKLGEECIKN
jgi:hypothetical protein